MQDDQSYNTYVDETLIRLNKFIKDYIPRNWNYSLGKTIHNIPRIEASYEVLEEMRIGIISDRYPNYVREAINRFFLEEQKADYKSLIRSELEPQIRSRVRRDYYNAIIGKIKKLQDSNRFTKDDLSWIPEIKELLDDR